MNNNQIIGTITFHYSNEEPVNYYKDDKENFINVIKYHFDYMGINSISIKLYHDKEINKIVKEMYLNEFGL